MTQLSKYKMFKNYIIPQNNREYTKDSCPSLFFYHYNIPDFLSSVRYLVTFTSGLYSLQVLRLFDGEGVSRYVL